jgi:hypothetical protein
MTPRVVALGMLLLLLSACEGHDIRRAREDVLRDDLFLLRSIVNQYTLDKQSRPQSLNDLVVAGYLRGFLPIHSPVGRTLGYLSCRRIGARPALWTFIVGQ